MVLDIEWFREAEDRDPDAPNPEFLREAQRKRFKNPELVDQVQEADLKWRQNQFRADAIRTVTNHVNKAYGAIMKTSKGKAVEGEDGTLEDGITNTYIDEQMSKEKEVKNAVKGKIGGLNMTQLKNLRANLKQAEEANEVQTSLQLTARDNLMRQVGNLLQPSVPIFKDEEHNKPVRTIGDVTTRKKYSHVDLIVMIDGVDYARGVAVSGGRGYYLKGAGFALETALVAFAHDFLSKRGSTFLSPPVFMNKEVMAEVAQLSQFADELYKVEGKRSEVEGDADVEEKFLIATAEQPLAAFHRKERLNVKDLPMKYAGVSECFRQEVGSHGRDSKGIFRVHQFKKVEQFCIAEPDQSPELFEEMIKNAEDFCKAIGLSYQVVNIVSGDLNLAAAIKYDLEAWFPSSGAFRELVSCSNCTDYQSRRLDIKCGEKKLMEKKATYAHMLNSTLCATTRMICCILETFQVGDYETGGGVVIPECLRPFMPDHYGDFIPFVCAPPVDDVPAAGKKGKGKGKK